MTLCKIVFMKLFLGSNFIIVLLSHWIHSYPFNLVWAINVGLLFTINSGLTGWCWRRFWRRWWFDLFCCFWFVLIRLRQALITLWFIKRSIASKGILRFAITLYFLFWLFSIHSCLSHISFPDVLLIFSRDSAFNVLN